MFRRTPVRRVALTAAGVLAAGALAAGTASAAPSDHADTRPEGHQSAPADNSHLTPKEQQALHIVGHVLGVFFHAGHAAGQVFQHEL